MFLEHVLHFRKDYCANDHIQAVEDNGVRTSAEALLSLPLPTCPIRHLTPSRSRPKLVFSYIRSPEKAPDRVPFR